MSRKNFLQGAAILALAGLVVRVIGAFYRIPLAYIVGQNGIALYTLAYPFYNYLLIFSTAGVPSAISKMVSEHMAVGDEQGAKRIFRLSMLLLFVVGLVSAIVLGFSSQWIANMIKAPRVGPSILALSPALFFVALISVLRGYFQGLQNMNPTAYSQILEQLFRITLSLYLAYKFTAYGVEYGVAGALLGVSISEVVTMIALYILYLRGQRMTVPIRIPWGVVHEKLSAKDIYSRLLKLSIPIMLASSIMAMAFMIDSVFLSGRLHEAGFSEDVGEQLIGLLGMANNIVNITSVLSMALSMSLVPSLAEAIKLKQMDRVASRTATGIKLSIVLVLPATVGLALFSLPIIDLLYGGTIINGYLPISASLLTAAAASGLFLSLVQTTNGVLQGLGKVHIPVISLGVGALAKLMISYFVVSMPGINIFGAPIGTIACYFLASLVNLIMVSNYTQFRFNPWSMVIRPMLAAAVMGAGSWLAFMGIRQFIPDKIAVLPTIVVGIVLYLLAIIVFRVVSEEEMLYLPKGRSLVNLCRRWRIME